MSEEKLKILKMLENKEITVEEALQRLQAESDDGEDVTEELRDTVSGVLNEVGESLREAGVAVNEVMTGVGNELRNNKDIQSALAGLLSGIRSLGAGKTFEFEHTGEFASETVNVTLNGANGRLAVYGWDKPNYRLQIKVTLRGNLDTATEDDAAKSYSLEAGPDRLCLNTEKRQHNVSVSNVLYLPKELSYQMDLKTSNGSIRVEKVKGEEFVADTSNGSVTLEECSFDITRIDTSNGAVSVSGICGSTAVRTSNGSIRIHSLAAVQAEGELKLSTSNGSIKLSLDRNEDTAYDISASTSNGRVKADLQGLSVRTTGKNQLNAQSENFDQAARRIKISARTSNGAITVTHL